MVKGAELRRNNTGILPNVRCNVGAKEKYKKYIYHFI